MSNVEIVGADATIAAIGSNVADFNKEVNALIQAAGQEGDEVAAGLAPVRTGVMRASIQYVPGDMVSYTASPVYYSPYVEYGTYKMQAQEFMQPAFDIAEVHLLSGIAAL